MINNNLLVFSLGWCPNSWSASNPPTIAAKMYLAFRWWWSSNGPGNLSRSASFTPCGACAGMLTAPSGSSENPASSPGSRSYGTRWRQRQSRWILKRCSRTTLQTCASSISVNCPSVCSLINCLRLSSIYLHVSVYCMARSILMNEHSNNIFQMHWYSYSDNSYISHLEFYIKLVMSTDNI